MNGPNMTGPQHYREAERQAEVGAELADEGRLDDAQVHLALGQVHATLALAAATAYPAVRDYWGDDTDTSREWSGVAS
ncbi:MAG: hypothetical protein M3291_00915 [Actinomycetota bacterium]|nr:hypothetical protein [Actinomycetota bacterium]